MRSYDYRNTPPHKVEPKKSIDAANIEGSVTIFTSRGVEFTLHRVSRSMPPRFYQMFSDRTDIPVISSELNSAYGEPYATFMILGNVLTERAEATFITDDGYEVVHSVRRFSVQEPSDSPEPWRRNGRCGFQKTTRNRHLANSIQS